MSDEREGFQLWQRLAAIFVGDGRRITRILIVLILGLYTLSAVSLISRTHHGLGPDGAPMFYDFSVFYQAGAFADSGDATAAYNDASMFAAERATFPGATLHLPWSYPPTFLLAFMPLAALPYVVAWAIWSGVTYAAYLLVVRQLVDTRYFWLLAVAPAAYANLVVGQNGLLSVAVLGGGVLLLGRRPILGGVVLGLIAYKPQLAVLAPVVLVFARQWRALAGAAASQVAIALLSVVVMGVGPWTAFLRKMIQPGDIFTSSTSSWRAIPSMQILGRSLGLDGLASSVIHWTVAFAAAGSAVWLWKRQPSARCRAGALAAAATLFTPYLRGYDLALLVLPFAALLPHEGVKVGLVSRGVLFAAWIIPGVLMVTAPQIQYGALISAATLILMVWRAARSGEPSCEFPGVRPHGGDAAIAIVARAPALKQ